ncbi:YbaB/EbfC family nucleoid-associated protein [Nonomuraea cavernae]|uniref:YbaB/EbfC family nucleoid-associated protein n=1 Tax=Nonomuraea cavernae TaxID=2045107 RepID=UPI00340297DA
MSDEFRSAVEELAAEYNRQAVHLREAYGKLTTLSAVGKSDDGMVTVTVGPRGQVRDIVLNPRVYRKLSPSELSQSIMKQISVATSEVAERTKELMGPFVPEGLPYEDIFGDGAGLEAFLPQPVEFPPDGPAGPGERG